MDAQNFNFITSQQAYGIKYLQLPEVLLYGEKYKKLSDSAKLAYTVLQNRLGYSLKNHWIDDNNMVYFIFTNQALHELFGWSSAKVVRIKKELEQKGLLFQINQGFDPKRKKNLPNRLYLANLEVTAKDVYHKQNLEQKISELQESSQNSLPENKLESLEPSDIIKMKHNLYNLDTNKIHEDTHLDFSTSKYSPEQIALQNADLKDHLTEIMDAKANTDFISHAALGVIKTWCNTPAEVERVIQIILNAKNATVKEMSDKKFSLQSVLLSLGNEVLQQEVTTWLRSFFNKVRASEHNPKKRIKNADNYLYRTMYNGFTKFAHTQLQAHADVSEKRIK